MNTDDLTPDLKARARECRTPEELLALAETEGVELSLEELDMVTGGREWYQPEKCNDNCYPYNCGTFV